MPDTATTEGVVIHDPGGKVRIALPAGMRAGATFCNATGGPGDTHRPLLWREWGEQGAPYALFAGMNPSTADARFNDPTCGREVGFTQRWGLTAYRKVNVMDLRATDPRRLLLPDTAPRSTMNLPLILQMAKNAERVVLAFGALPKQLRPYAAEVVVELRDMGIPLFCLGTTLDGSPRHPSRIANATPLIPWKGWKV